ncbi:hypothetical protein JL722_9155 [Aureococcus anophagefferens]|nr:hypothetical protein JL722_9155 [Aureococcus anophagefferens]
MEETQYAAGVRAYNSSQLGTGASLLTRCSSHDAFDVSSRLVVAASRYATTSSLRIGLKSLASLVAESAGAAAAPKAKAAVKLKKKPVYVGSDDDDDDDDAFLAGDDEDAAAPVARRGASRRNAGAKKTYYVDSASDDEPAWEDDGAEAASAEAPPHGARVPQRDELAVSEHGSMSDADDDGTGASDPGAASGDYCYCGDGSGPMVGCDARESCPRGGWFHAECLEAAGEAAPGADGGWFCRDCRGGVGDTADVVMGDAAAKATPKKPGVVEAAPSDGGGDDDFGTARQKAAAPNEASPPKKTTSPKVPPPSSSGVRSPPTASTREARRWTPRPLDAEGVAASPLAAAPVSSSAASVVANDDSEDVLRPRSATTRGSARTCSTRT